MKYKTSLDLREVEDQIGYVFVNKDILKQALSHSSYTYENKGRNIESNERLEFLGDAVLNVVVSTYIYQTFPELTEGELTKLRANVVCEAALVKCARSIELGGFIRLGKGLSMNKGNERSSILCDAFEAVIGAIYMDSGIDAARTFILNKLAPMIEQSEHTHAPFVDYKTMLQEYVQKSGTQTATYKTIDESGPDHNKTFTVEVNIMNVQHGTGSGKSKKEAEQAAAREALQKFGEIK